MRPAPTRGSKRGAPGSVLAGSPPAPTRAPLCHCRCSRRLPRRAPRLLSGVRRRLLRLGRRGPAERWKARGVKVEPNFTAGGGTRGRGDACAPGAGCRADGAALGGLPGGGAPLRPPRQWRPHDCAHQRIIASRDISADTPIQPGGGVRGRPDCHRRGSLRPPGSGTALQHHAISVERPFSLQCLGPRGRNTIPRTVL